MLCAGYYRVCPHYVQLKNLLHTVEINDAEIAGSVRISTIPGHFAIVFGAVAVVIEYHMIDPFVLFNVLACDKRCVQSAHKAFISAFRPT